MDCDDIPADAIKPVETETEQAPKGKKQWPTIKRQLDKISHLEEGQKETNRRLEQLALKLDAPERSSTQASSPPQNEDRESVISDLPPTPSERPKNDSKPEKPQPSKASRSLRTRL